MNTSENGSVARLKLLILDDEQDIINALTRFLRKEYELVSFNNGEEALVYLEKNPVDIIMSDMRMPMMDGAEFLTKSRILQPDTIRLLLTGHSDIDATVKAINEGAIFTYLAKPWDNEDLKLKIAKAGEHYLLKKEKERLAATLVRVNQKLEDLNSSLEMKVIERTRELELSKQKLQNSLDVQKELLHDALDMMSATIEYRTGSNEGDLKRIAAQSRAIAVKLGLDENQCRSIYLSALLHEIGVVGLSDQALDERNTPGTHFLKVEESYPVIGATIVGRIKRMSFLIENIRHQNENYNGSGFPDHLAGEKIPVGARIIRIVKDFDYLIAGVKNKRKMSIFNAESWMRDKAEFWYDKKILETFISILTKHEDTESEGMVYSIGVERLKSGDTLAKDLIINGNLMLKAGQQVSSKLIERLRLHEQNYNTKLTLFTV